MHIKNKLRIKNRRGLKNSRSLVKCNDQLCDISDKRNSLTLSLKIVRFCVSSIQIAWLVSHYSLSFPCMLNHINPNLTRINIFKEHVVLYFILSTFCTVSSPGQKPMWRICKVVRQCSRTQELTLNSRLWMFNLSLAAI